MRKFQRAAVVAAAIAGLSAFAAGVSVADGYEGAPPVTANATANAVAVGGGYYAPPEEQGQPEAGPEAQQQGQPEEQRNYEPEQGYGGEHQGEGEGE
ncbi:hypothetical protein [Streptomyces naphthomycinicus]|uniref:hypothetical protein n=1 Tax=Streptomyces naphthomycinicus TaxID=2872625 RepID=UPI001CEDD2EB|nr:hypothetical protein [Streptomyces sp. TML10]